MLKLKLTANVHGFHKVLSASALSSIRFITDEVVPMLIVDRLADASAYATHFNCRV